MKHRVLYVDESGDPGWKAATSPLFVLTAVTSENADIFSSVASEIRDSLGISGELKWRLMGQKRWPRALEIIGRAPIKWYSVVVDKADFVRHFPEYTGNPGFLYRHAMETLFGLVKDKISRNLIYEFDQPAQRGVPDHIVQLTYKVKDHVELAEGAPLPKQFKISSGTTITRAIRFVDSRTSPGVQVADVVGGALGKAYREKDLRLRGLLSKSCAGFCSQPANYGKGYKAIHAQVPGELSWPNPL